MPTLPEGPVRRAVTSHLTVYRAPPGEIERLERAALAKAGLRPE